PGREIRCRAKADPWSSSHPHVSRPIVERSRVGCRAGAMTEGAYEARLNMARRTLYALRTSSGRRRPATRAKIFSASSVGTVLLLSPTSVRSRRGTSRATEMRYRLSIRSEEHTSELQSRSDLVCRLLLEKKKKNTKNSKIISSYSSSPSKYLTTASTISH